MQRKLFLRFVILIIAVPLAITVRCQETLDVKVEPKPFDYDKLYRLNKRKPVKSIVYFVTRYSNKSVKTDTISEEYLTKEGNRLSFVPFNENRRGAITTYKYSQKNNSVEWVLKEPGDKNRIYFNRNTKNQQDKDLVQYQATIVNGDTTIRTGTKFFYSPMGLLIKKSKSGSMGGSQLGTSAIVYEYRANDMVLAKSYYDASNAGSYLAIAYTYNIDHLPVEKKAYSVRKGIADTPALYSYYLYDKGLLAAEKYEDFNDKGKKIETKIDYFYNSKQQLIRCHSSRDTLLTNEVYEYNGDQLKKHTIYTNTKIGLNKAAVVYPSTPAKVSFTFDFFYEYDEFGNVIKIIELLDNQIYMEKTKKLTYY